MAEKDDMNENNENEETDEEESSTEQEEESSEETAADEESADANPGEDSEEEDSEEDAASEEESEEEAEDAASEEDSEEEDSEEDAASEEESEEEAEDAASEEDSEEEAEDVEASRAPEESEEESAEEESEEESAEEESEEESAEEESEEESAEEESEEESAEEESEEESAEEESAEELSEGVDVAVDDPEPEEAEDGPLRGYAAYYAHPDHLLAAARHARESKYDDFEAYSPFPIHGMDEAMGLSRSWIPWVTFGAGIVGFLTANALQFGMMTFDWPMIIGGKPFAPWPSFVPVMFELTVLISGVTTAVVMLKAAGCFQKADVIDERITNDRFVLWISADDKEFEEDEVESFLSDLNPLEIKRVHQ